MKDSNLWRRRGTRKHGIALIFTAGILVILAAMGTAFFALSHSSTLAAVRYSDMVRADLLARAGLAEAVVRLRNQAYIKTEDPGDNWSMVDYLHGLQGKRSFPYGNGKDDDGDGIADNELKDASSATKVYKPYSRSLGSSVGEDSDRFTLEVSDAAGKININAGGNVAVILDNLCRVIGPPLVAANLDALQPRRWAVEADPTDPIVTSKVYDTAQNANDTATNNDLYYTMTLEDGTVTDGRSGRPIRASGGTALYGDGYAIAGYRARQGGFRSIEDVKNALTYVDRNNNGQLDDPLEHLEIAIKFAALRDHITVGSWVDTNTVCTGKFEWVHVDTVKSKTIAIDRDKSWVIDDPVTDPFNQRGSLRGSYLSIMNGHGSGQLRRIRTNGIDWVEVDGGFAISPGPISSYMIIAAEEALLMNPDGTDAPYSYLTHMDPSAAHPVPVGARLLPRTKADGTLDRTPKSTDKVDGVPAGVPDYSIHPLCIHRAPVNINTASDKVLAALFLGINVQHGHPQALGTETDVPTLKAKWKTTEPHGVQRYLLTAAGLKRIPASSGKPILDKVWGTSTGEVQPPPVATGYDVAYINNHNKPHDPDWSPASTGVLNDAHELACRIVMARQSDPSLKYIDPISGIPTATNTGVLRNPFRNYDDFYFRVIKPWDERRYAEGGGSMSRLSTMVMANFNSNTDILKFNPNIEWIDRFSRNFTEQEPVMVYTDTAFNVGTNAYLAANGHPVFNVDVPATASVTATSHPIYTAVTDPNAINIFNEQKVPPLKSSQKNAAGAFIDGYYITRNFRYKSDELIDKTDLNRSTTEFSFDSNGIFHVVSSGQIINPLTGQLLAERKLESLVKVYDVWRESTQQQFVMGTISKAYGDRALSTNRTQMSCTGQLARDASGLVEPKGLTTLPEPLLPLKAKIETNIGGVAYTTGTNANKKSSNFEAVTDCDTKPLGTGVPLDAFENPRTNPYDATATPLQVPEVLANRVLPARWDGQLVLSTNTSSYDPTVAGDFDTFLASFDGDTDTATCRGNGREQAKWPYSAEPDDYAPAADGTYGFKYTGNGHKYRCLQSIGLLGILNDKLISTDPGIPLIDGVTPFNEYSAANKDQVRWIYPFIGISSALMPLKLKGTRADGSVFDMYWNNLSVRMGALRTDGVYLTAPGVSGNTGTLKYLFSTTTSTAPVNSEMWGAWNAGGNPKARDNKLNFQESKYGNLVTMWTKTVWHHDDMRNHEFLNPGNEAMVNSCNVYYFQKMGQYKFTGADENAAAGHCSIRSELNDLASCTTWNDTSGFGSMLHGGYAKVNATTSPKESPGYRVQPFRWSYVGLRTHNVGTGLGYIDPAHKSPAGTWGYPCSPSNPPAGSSGPLDPAWPHQPAYLGTYGHLWNTDQDNLTFNQAMMRHVMRPIIDTALLGEGPSYWPAMPFTGPRAGKFEVRPVWPSASHPYAGTVGGGPHMGAMLRYSFKGYSGGGGWMGGVQNSTNMRWGDPRDLFSTTTSITDPNPLAAGRNAGARIGTRRAGEGQDVKWVWAEPYGKLALDPNMNTSSLKSFGINNLNFGNFLYNTPFDPMATLGTGGVLWHARNLPEDGTYAVIDEFKISGRDRALVDDEKPDWDLTAATNDRAYREMRTSRYYLPPSPGSRLNPENGGPPTFTSQTLIQSLRGFDKVSASQYAVVVRASWNVFTPRFMCEYQEAPLSPFSRVEKLTHYNTVNAAQAPITLKFKGPFDYIKYNDYTDQGLDFNPPGTAYSVNRPAPSNYAFGLAQANRGVEVELLNDTTPLPAKQQDNAMGFQDAALNPVSNTTSVLTDPSLANRFGDMVNPVRVRVDKLRYRVRFRCPVDPLVDPTNAAVDADGKPCIDTTKQMLLDTPVFDDISVTYMLPVRVLDHREVNE